MLYDTIADYHVYVFDYYVYVVYWENKHIYNTCHLGECNAVNHVS